MKGLTNYKKASDGLTNSVRGLAILLRLTITLQSEFNREHDAREVP